MSSKPSEPRSIASQLVLLFTLAATALLGCALGIFYLMVVHHTFHEDNLFLADKVLALSADLTTNDWEKALSGSLRPPRPNEHSAYWVRIIDGNGQTMMETPGMRRLLAPEIFPAPHRVAGEVEPRDYRTVDKLFSLVTMRQSANEQSYTVQVAQDRSEDEEFKHQFGLLLIAGWVAGAFLSALIALTVTRKGLQPLAQMTQSLARVGPTHLTERLSPATWPRELKPLAAGFDEMLDRLEDSFTRLSQFSADLAHELRTPIANMLGEAEVTLTRTRTPEEYREVVESSAAECQRLSGIIENLLFLAKAETGSGAVQPTLFEGREAVEKIANYYETVAEEQRVSILCQGHAKVWADAMLFERAVSNLIENALRSTPAAGKIVISMAEADSQSEISVSDTGSGIDPEHLPRIFDRFYRVDSSRSSQGTGLGLSLVKSIMKLHGGSAGASSEVGRGTTVMLRFPARPNRGPAA